MEILSDSSTKTAENREGSASDKAIANCLELIVFVNNGSRSLTARWIRHWQERSLYSLAAGRVNSTVNRGVAEWIGMHKMEREAFLQKWQVRHGTG